MQVPQLFAFIVLPMTMLGCIYFPWTKLRASVGFKSPYSSTPGVHERRFRAALTRSPHMSLFAVYGALLGSQPSSSSGVKGFEAESSATE